MTEVIIKDEDLASLKGKTIIVTGGSSGIGFATVNLLLSLGASVINGDVQPPPESFASTFASSPSFTYLKTDVTVWADLVALFKTALEKHGGRIDHVYANAGVVASTGYLDLSPRVDEATGDPLEPPKLTYDVNLRGAINTAALALYYMQRQEEPVGGSVVFACSISAMQRFRAVDYAASKHGVLGFMRGLHQLIVGANVPIRVNATAPSWTQGGVIPEKFLVQLGEPLQSPDAVARGAALLMADEARQGHVLHIAKGRYKEIEEAVLLPAYETGVLYEDTTMEDTVLKRVGDIAGGFYRG